MSQKFFEIRYVQGSLDLLMPYHQPAGIDASRTGTADFQFALSPSSESWW